MEYKLLDELNKRVLLVWGWEKDNIAGWEYFDKGDVGCKLILYKKAEVGYGDSYEEPEFFDIPNGEWEYKAQLRNVSNTFDEIVHRELDGQLQNWSYKDYMYKDGSDFDDDCIFFDSKLSFITYMESIGLKNLPSSTLVFIEEK